MSTTWTSIINTNEDGTPQGVTIGLENGNYTFDGAGNSGTEPLPGGGTGSGVPFTGLISTGDTFRFGSNSEFDIGTSDGSTLFFNLKNETPLDNQVVFNFDDKFKIYGNGVIGLSKLDGTPGTDGYAEGSIVRVGNDLKILITS
jgi:hypothetical protein